MKSYLLMIFASIVSMISAVSIYDIQYTTDSGTGTYPSTYASQIVSTSGICTGISFNNNSGYFLSMPEGGAWKGIFIYDSSNAPLVGDLVELTGQVWEYNGWTEIRTVTAFQVVSHNNTIPEPVSISTASINQEDYESVLCKTVNASCTQSLDQYNQWMINDATGEAMVAGGFFNQNAISDLIQIGNLYTNLTGIISYSYNTFRLNPRNNSDVVVSQNSQTVVIPSQEALLNTEITIPLNVNNLDLSSNYNSFQFDFQYDPQILSFNNFSQINTLSSNGTAMISNQSNGLFHLQFISNGMISGTGSLINLNFQTMNAGNAFLNATNFNLNDTPFYVIQGNVLVINPDQTEYPDTITVIQRPLLNIPAICIPGENINIECVAPTSTQNWAVSIVRKNANIPMQINSANYQNNPPRWVINVNIPNVPLFEMYDLKVMASGGIEDISKHAIHIIPSRKTSYYFAHVTDVHMPTHIFWPETGYDTDSTETVDFREVIKDLNIIRPEFVLLTGDLVNQGENEELDNLHWYSKAQRLLTEFEVPVYLVTGNHDIGGWDEQPPPDGTARRNWWKFFGWSWLNNPDPNYPYHTQDYSFNYGSIHFTGLEAYDNYDNWWSNIYGSQSFTNQQTQWLQDDLFNYPADTKVLFYHYDFSDQINLNSLGVSLALWGHIHQDQGSLNQAPYSLATESTCDGARAYRIIQVLNNMVIPFPTLSAGSAGNKISLSFFPSNIALSDSVTASLTNAQSLDFDNALVKFNMPPGDFSYTCQNGIIEQIERSPDKNVCYVRVNILHYESKTISLWKSGVPNSDYTESPSPLIFSLPYPNPFNNSVKINIDNLKNNYIIAEVYNIKGEKVCDIKQSGLKSGQTQIVWNGKNNQNMFCSNGFYFIKTKIGKVSHTSKVLLMK